jgi:hypothetical protein
MSFQKLIVFPYLHLISDFLNKDELCFCNNYSNDLIAFILTNKTIYNCFKENFTPKFKIKPSLPITLFMPSYTYNYLTSRKICECNFSSKLFEDFYRAVRCVNEKKKKVVFKDKRNGYISETFHSNNNINAKIIRMLNCYCQNLIVTDDFCCNGKGIKILFKK